MNENQLKNYQTKFNVKIKSKLHSDIYHLNEIDLRCYESMSKNLNETEMKKVKTLYKLTRNKLLYKDYYCNYCGMKDFNKYFMKNHVKTLHDENDKEVKIFRCKICGHEMAENEIIMHEIKYH